jgi:hypothetical protein
MIINEEFDTILQPLDTSLQLAKNYIMQKMIFLSLKNNQQIN